MQRSRIFVLLFATLAFVACDDTDTTTHDTGADSGDAGNLTPDAVTVAPAPASFAFLSPDNGHATTDETIEVKVGWSDGTPAALIHATNDGQAVEVLPPFDGDRFSFTAALADGVNNVTVQLVREDSSVVERELIVLRTSPVAGTPQLAVVSPATGTSVDSETTEVALAWVNGTPSDVTWQRGEEAAVSLDGPFDGTGTTVEIPLAVGVYPYTFEAAFGDTTLSTTIVLVRAVEDGALVVLSPVDGTETQDAQIVVEGLVATAGDVVAVQVLRDDIVVDATLVDSAQGTSFSAVVPLVIGSNAVTIEAEVAGGLLLETTLALTRVEDETAPEFVSVFPSDSHDVRGSEAFLRVAASDNVAVETVTATIDAQVTSLALSEDRQWATGTVPIAPGFNTITLTVTDTSGNETTIDHALYGGFRLSAGGAHGGILIDGDVYTWGRNNKGQVGVGYTSTLSGTTDEFPHPTAPVHIDLESELVSLSFTQNTSIALASDGTVWAWGDNDEGQLGVGTAATDDAFDEDDRLSPVQVTGLANIVDISRGFDHGMALDATGQVWTWGDNGDGQLGDGTTDSRDVAVLVPGLDDAVLILGASATSYAVRADGTVWAWGENTYGNLGSGTEDDDAHAVPAPVPGLADVIDIAAGRDHVLALTKSGEVYAWGLNGSNQVDAGEEHVFSPTLRTDVQGAVGVFAGGNQSFFEDADGRLFGWGQNGSGNLGVAVDSDVIAPTEPVFGVSTVVSVGIGPLQGFAMRHDGTAFGWGWSFEGSLGGGDGVIARWGYRVPILLELPENDD